MRIVFAGTPEFAVSSLGGAARPPPRLGREKHPHPPAPPGPGPAPPPRNQEPVARGNKIY